MNYDSTIPTRTRTSGFSASRKNFRCCAIHLLRLDRASRHDRFMASWTDSFIERYGREMRHDGTVIIAFFEDVVVRGAAELHPPEQSPTRSRRSPSA